jgi:hypothetical protein
MVHEPVGAPLEALISPLPPTGALSFFEIFFEAQN